MPAADIDQSASVRLARQRLYTLRRLFHLAAQGEFGAGQNANAPLCLDRLPRKAQSPAAWPEGYAGSDQANTRAGVTT